jgi:ABC-type transport system involved in multi-copper enzyme maturation permease subunit
MTRWLLRRELALVFGARVTWVVAAISAVLVGHGFVLALDIYSSASRAAQGHQLLQQAVDPLSGLVRPTLGGLYLATAILLPVIAARGLAIEKERHSYGPLALRARSTHKVVIAKLVAALAAASLLLVAPVVLFVAFAACGGHLDARETATALVGHALDLTLVATTSVAAAAATRTVAQASVLAIALSLGSWAIDASGEFAALAWMGSLEWASIGHRLGPLERGVLHLGSLGWLLVAGGAATAVAIVIARIEHGARRWWIAGAIAAVTIVLLAVLGSVHRGYDGSEQRRQSFPLAVVDAMRELPDDLAMDVWLDRDDNRRTELERGPLAKLVLARPDIALRMPLDADDGALASRDADYGRIVVHLGQQTRETRSSSDEEIVGILFEAAGRAKPHWPDSSYPGYPFVAEGATRTSLVVLAYLVMPLMLVAFGLLVTRSRRRS